MVKRCAHGVCKSDSRYPERLSGGVVFHPFPKPKTQRERCLIWIEKCGRPNYQLNVHNITKHKYVCSKHFINGKPTPEFPNPVNAVLGPDPAKILGGCRKLLKKLVCVQDTSSGSTSTSDAGESQQHAVDSESPEHPPLPGRQLEREPEEEEQSCQSTEKEKELEAENNNLKLTLSLQEIKLKSLKAQIGTFKKKTLMPELLQRSKIHKMFEYSTGFTYERFNQLCSIFDIPSDPHTNQMYVPLNYKHSDCKIAEMPLRSQLLFVLMKLRNNEDFKSLAFKFNINMQTASNIFTSWIHYMFDILSEIPIWPHRDVITQNMPETYKVDYPNTFAILNCTELKMKRPIALVLQSQKYSNYKSTNTLKSLVACDPRGAVIFSSALLTGAMSDKEVVRQCGILPLLQKLIDSGYLQKGDGIMADKGFLIEEEMQALGLKLNLLPFSRSKSQMPAVDVLVTKHRVHVERAVAKIKKFKIVSGKVPITRLGIINRIWYVVSVLSNFQPHILK